ncbi:MAG TPA: alpha/beta fold hydrolase [Bryobacteraceae bacterium]|nr:alpha/beta fold hydrolase [Bryobacteraceae bacterium]
MTAICVLLCAVAGAVLCESAIRAPRRHPPAAPPGLDPSVRWRDVQIIASDGAVLRAWLLRPRNTNENAVIVLHGIADSRAGEIGLARMFLAEGYTVLLPDSRGQGDSGGELVTYGLREAEDLHRWVTWLIANQHPRSVFGMGESLGGAVLLQSLAIERRFSAVVAESAFASFERIADDRVAHRVPRVLALPAVWMGFEYARLRYGLDFRAASPEAAMPGIMTPVLLIHGMADDRTPPIHSEILAAENPRWVRLWLVPGAGHTGAFGTDPRDFQRRVLAWFAGARSR